MFGLTIRFRALGFLLLTAFIIASSAATRGCSGESVVDLVTCSQSSASSQVVPVSREQRNSVALDIRSKRSGETNLHLLQASHCNQLLLSVELSPPRFRRPSLMTVFSVIVPGTGSSMSLSGSPHGNILAKRTLCGGKFLLVLYWRRDDIRRSNETFRKF